MRGAGVSGPLHGRIVDEREAARDRLPFAKHTTEQNDTPRRTLREAASGRVRRAASPGE
jgi:hypothetical protein